MSRKAKVKCFRVSGRRERVKAVRDERFNSVRRIGQSCRPMASAVLESKRESEIEVRLEEKELVILVMRKDAVLRR